MAIVFYILDNKKVKAYTLHIYAIDINQAISFPNSNREQLLNAIERRGERREKEKEEKRKKKKKGKNPRKYAQIQARKQVKTKRVSKEEQTKENEEI